MKIRVKHVQELIFGLTSQERKRFILFLQSPYHNSNLRLERLFEIISGASQGSVSAINIHEQLFPQQEYKLQRVYDHISTLLRHLERFFGQEYLEAHPLEERILRTRYLLQRSLLKAAERNYKKAHKALSKQHKLDEQQLLQTYRLAQIADEAFLAKELRQYDGNLKKADQQLDTYYFSQKLMNACEMLNRSNVIQSGDEARFIEDIIQWIDKTAPLKAHPLIAVYYHLYACLKGPLSAERFSRFRQSLKDHQVRIAESDCRILYAYGQNICTKQINKGQSEYLQIYFELNQEMEAANLLLENGSLDHLRYKNLVTVGLRLGEMDWVHHFVERYRSHLAVEFQDAAYHYNLAAYYYAQKEYRQALRRLWKVEIDDDYYELGKRAMTLKIYYESDDQDGLDDQVRSFRAYLARNKNISEYQRRAHAGLIRFSQRLAKLRNKRTALSQKKFRQSLIALTEQIKGTQQITNRDWVLAQCDILMLN